jgi:hypothetical protein
MPIEVRFLDGGTGQVLACSGHLTGAELIELEERRVAHPELVAGLRYHLADLGEVTELDVSSEQIRRLVDLSARSADHVPRIALAIVAPEPHQYGLGRMWQTYLGLHARELPWETRILRDRESAEAWLADIVEAMFGERPAFRPASGPPQGPSS